MNSPAMSLSSPTSDLPAAQKNRLADWADLAISAGWLAQDTPDELQSASDATPGQLFSQEQRPLVAGLFGGTGVGKSTLLNRLAGEPVARASAERPTSRRITVYVHRSLSVDRLPEKLPMRRMRTALHNNELYRHVMFIDMPDFDSVEEANRELVDLWLPHLDVVMYVVSPERYRDDQGWQLMRQHATAHAWLFIINQWDRGNPLLRDDFTQQLAAQGLPDPLIYCTDCANPAHAPGAEVAQAEDDFASLQETLQSLSNDQIISGLQDRGVVARLQSLKSLSDRWLVKLGSEEMLASLSARWQASSDQEHADIDTALQWPISRVAASHTDNTPFWRRLFGLGQRTTQTDKSALGQLTQSLNERLTSLLESFSNQQAHECSIPLTAIRQAVSSPHELVLENTQKTLESSLNQALQFPGKPWQRRLHKLTRSLCILLPLASLLWISIRVISGFAEGGSDPSAYLGSQFAVNSALLLGISWLLPALVNTTLQPSREQAAVIGLRRGLDEVMQASQHQASQSLDALSATADSLRSSYKHLWSELPIDDDTALPEPVRRMLTQQISHDTPNRKLDVRANTHNSTDAAPLS